MPIPFVRGYQNGRRRACEITRDPGIETLAHAFLGRGGRYLCEILKSGQAHFMALIDVKDEETGELEPRVVSAAVCDNSEEVNDAVDFVVTDSVRYIPETPKSAIKIPTATETRRLTRAELKNSLSVVRNFPA
jgi:hypothetical protein